MYVKFQDNPADFTTKNLVAEADRYKKVRIILYNVYPLVKEDENVETLYFLKWEY